jgi:hypothetical protein
MYLEDIEDTDHLGIRQAHDLNTPTAAEYDDMHTDDRPDDDDEKAVDKYLNVELIMDVGTNDERRRRVVKRLQGLDDRITTRSFIPGNMKSNLQTDLVKSTKRI